MVQIYQDIHLRLNRVLQLVIKIQQGRSVIILSFVMNSLKYEINFWSDNTRFFFFNVGFCSEGVLYICFRGFLTESFDLSRYLFFLRSSTKKGLSKFLPICNILECNNK